MCKRKAKVCEVEVTEVLMSRVKHYHLSGTHFYIVCGVLLKAPSPCTRHDTLYCNISVCQEMDLF